MKYLKQYDEFNEGIISNFKNAFGIPMSLWEWFTEFHLLSFRDSPKNPEDYKELRCSYNNIKNLKGIEKFINLEKLECEGNLIKNLKGIENCKNIRILDCYNNKLKNLDEVKNLTNLELLTAYKNPFEEPIPIEIVNKFGFNNIYGVICHHQFPRFQTEKGLECGECGEILDKKTLKPVSTNCVDKFKSYEFQKKFLTEHPDRIKDLEPFGLHEDIKIEFPALVRGSEWGFFDLEGVEK